MKNKELKLFLDKFNNSGKFILSENRYVFFSPGLFLMLLGIAVILMPRLFLFFIAVFFLTIGMLACVLIWKVLQFKQKLEKLSKEFQGNVIVQGVRVDGIRKQSDPFRNKQTNFFEEPISGDLSLTDINTSRDSKKITYH